MKRYVAAYAQDKIKSIRDNDQMKPEKADGIVNKIEEYVRLYQKGFITTDETMLLIARL